MGQVLFLMYLMLWAGFAVGSVLLAGLLLVRAARLVRGEAELGFNAARVSVFVAGALLALAYAAALLPAFDSDDPGRVPSVVPPAAFGVAAALNAGLLLVARTRAGEP